MNRVESFQEIRFDANEPDYSPRAEPWSETAKRVALLVAKILLFPWGLYCGIKYVTQRLVMTVLYPAQSKVGQFFIKRSADSISKCDSQKS